MTDMNTSNEAAEATQKPTLKLKPITRPEAAPAAPEAVKPASMGTIKLKPIASPNAEAAAGDAVKPSTMGTIKLKTMTPPPAEPAPSAEEAEKASAIPISAPASSHIPGVKQTIRLRPPVSSAAAQKNEQTETGVPQESSAPTIQIKKPESSSPTIQIKKPESSSPTIQIKKPESSSPTIQINKPNPSAQTIQIKKPEPSSPTIQVKKPEENGTAEDAGTHSRIMIKKKDPRQEEFHGIPGLNIPKEAPGEQKPEETAEPAAAETEKAPEAAEKAPEAAPVKAAPDAKPIKNDAGKKAKLPKVSKVTKSDEPNAFFLVCFCLTLIAVIALTYLVFAQYMNFYQEEKVQVPVPQILMPKQ